MGCHHFSFAFSVFVSAARCQRRIFCGVYAKTRRLSSNSVAKVIPKFENRKLTQIFDFNIPHNVIFKLGRRCVLRVSLRFKAVHGQKSAKRKIEATQRRTANRTQLRWLRWILFVCCCCFFFAILEELEHAKCSVRRHSADSTAVCNRVCAGADSMCQQLQFNFKIIFVCSQLSRHRRQPVYGQFGIVRLSFTQNSYSFSFTRVLGLHTFCHVNGVCVQCAFDRH